MNKQEAYKMVYEDLTKMGGMFVGKYDATNGSKKYMYGICAVMENIAYNSGKETYEEFSETFFENMKKSVDKANKQ